MKGIAIKVFKSGVGCMAAVDRKANTTSEARDNPELARLAISSAKLEEKRKACFEDSWFSKDNIGFTNGHKYADFKSRCRNELNRILKSPRRSRREKAWSEGLRQTIQVFKLERGAKIGKRSSSVG
jgi:hypothetical protein